MQAWRILAPIVLALALVPAADALPIEGLKDAALGVARDPEDAARDPKGSVDPILGEEPPAEDDPAFPDRVRGAFQDKVVVAGTIATVAAVGAVGLLLVSRYVDPKEALRNPQRSMLYGFVRGNPGVHLKLLSDEFGMKTSSILWHMRKLEAAQLVRSERANGFRVFYPVEGGLDAKKLSRAITALRNLNARHLLEYLQTHPGTSPAHCGTALGIHGGTVRWHLRKLRDFGLAEELVRDEGSVFFATPMARKALDALLGRPTVERSSTPSVPALPPRSTTSEVMR